MLSLAFFMESIEEIEKTYVFLKQDAIIAKSLKIQLKTCYRGVQLDTYYFLELGCSHNALIIHRSLLWKWSGTRAKLKICEKPANVLRKL